MVAGDGEIAAVLVHLDRTIMRRIPCPRHLTFSGCLDTEKEQVYAGPAWRELGVRVRLSHNIGRVADQLSVLTDTTVQINADDATAAGEYNAEPGGVVLPPQVRRERRVITAPRCGVCARCPPSTGGVEWDLIIPADNPLIKRFQVRRKRSERCCGCAH